MKSKTLEQIVNELQLECKVTTYGKVIIITAPNYVDECNITLYSTGPEITSIGSPEEPAERNYNTNKLKNVALLYTETVMLHDALVSEKFKIQLAN